MPNSIDPGVVDVTPDKWPDICISAIFTDDQAEAEVSRLRDFIEMIGSQCSVYANVRDTSKGYSDNPELFQEIDTDTYVDQVEAALFAIGHAEAIAKLRGYNPETVQHKSKIEYSESPIGKVPSRIAVIVWDQWPGRDYPKYFEMDWAWQVVPKGATVDTAQFEPTASFIGMNYLQDFYHDDVGAMMEADGYYDAPDIW